LVGVYNITQLKVIYTREHLSRRCAEASRRRPN